ncbi:MAG: hypothetical protein KGD68_06980 [Candidatus Lokiarchaeota archaeon]|nr:hypothetical protein [Candidatus Lokiarchaeota archaeon]
MISCIYFVQSNREYHALMSFLLDGDANISGISYLIFSEDVKSTDGRVFHTSNGYLMAVNFLSHTSDIQGKITIVGLNPNSLVDLYEIACEDANPQTKAITITESAESIILDKELETFIADRHFKFSDGSILTIPAISRKRRI